MMKRSAAFTLVELLIVIAILGVLVTILVPVVTGHMEEARRRSCAANLHAIGRKMYEYAHDNKGAFPNPEPNGTAPNCIGTYVTADKSSGDGSGNSRSLFLLVREDYCPAEAFICPSTQHKVSDSMNPATHYDFRKYDNLSYSYQVQKNGDYYNPTTLLSPGALVILADRSPISGEGVWTYWSTAAGHYITPLAGDKARYTENSFNHDQDGQNVLLQSGSVTFATTANVGIDSDNIWSWENPTTGADSTGSQPTCEFRKASPTSQKDSFLWP